MSEVDLSAESVLEEARRATGLSDFGDDCFREGLGVLLQTYDTTANYDEKARGRCRRRVVQLLSTRLRIEEAFKKHPEVRERRLRRPVYLTGFPRTGTSALLNLLAMDPAARPLLLWEGMCPDPLEGLQPGQSDPRLEGVRAYFDRAREKNPEFTKIHYASAETPEECVLLTAHTFCDAQLGIEPLMEPYGAWYQKQDLRASYAYYHDLLKMLDWQRPGERWLLKSPAHLWALDILVEIFPDVCIIITHRDPLDILPSYCSMMWALMKGRQSFDLRELGPTVLEYLARSMERALAARDRSDPRCFLDIDYQRFTEHPMLEVERIYHHFDLELPTEGERAMRDHLERNPKGMHGAHEYSMDEFGLTPEMVRSRLTAYIDRFELSGEA
jgi:hypothetical protein